MNVVPHIENRNYDICYLNEGVWMTDIESRVVTACSPSWQLLDTAAPWCFWKKKAVMVLLLSQLGRS